MNCTFPPRDDYDENVDSSHPEWSGRGGKVGTEITVVVNGVPAS